MWGPRTLNADDDDDDDVKIESQVIISFITCMVTGESPIFHVHDIWDILIGNNINLFLQQIKLWLQ